MSKLTRELDCLECLLELGGEMRGVCEQLRVEIRHQTFRNNKVTQQHMFNTE